MAYTPVYSNAAFVLIGVALERMTGKTFEDLFDEQLVRPLHLNATSYSAPPPVDEHALVPGSPRSSFWDADLGAFAPYASLSHRLTLTLTIDPIGPADHFPRPVTSLHLASQSFAAACSRKTSHVDGSSQSLSQMVSPKVLDGRGRSFVWRLRMARWLMYTRKQATVSYKPRFDLPVEHTDC